MSNVSRVSRPRVYVKVTAELITRARCGMRDQRDAGNY